LEQTIPTFAQTCTISDFPREQEWILEETFGINNEDKVMVRPQPPPKIKMLVHFLYKFRQHWMIGDFLSGTAL
jgi:hypothetical protein